MCGATNQIDYPAASGFLKFGLGQVAGPARIASTGLLGAHVACWVAYRENSRSMNILELIGAVLGIPVLVITVIGGLLSVSDHIRKFRRERRPHGSKGVGFCVLNRSDTNDGIVVKFLVVEDLIQFLTNLAQEQTNGTVTDVQAVGDYYTATILYPPGTDLSFRVVKRK